MRTLEDTTGALDSTTPRNVWQEYERRKRELAAQDLPPSVYEQKLRALCDELGF